MEQGFQPGNPDVISAEAEFSRVDCSPSDDEFIVLASDGLWDVLSNQEVVDFIKEKLCEESGTEVGLFPSSLSTMKETYLMVPSALSHGIQNDSQGAENDKLNQACQALAEHAIGIKGSADNVSIILVRIVDNTAPDLDHSLRNHFAGIQNTSPSTLYGALGGLKLEEVRIKPVVSHGPSTNHVMNSR